LEDFVDSFKNNNELVGHRIYRELRIGLYSIDSKKQNSNSKNREKEKESEKSKHKQKNV
jgi:hypothetical protein